MPAAMITNKKYPPNAPESLRFKPLKGPVTVVLDGRYLYSMKAGIRGKSNITGSTLKKVLVIVNVCAEKVQNKS